MNISANPSTPEPPVYGKTCRFLGLAGDPETRFGYPSLGNRCHRLTPIANISLAYQETWCLSGDFQKCAVYQGASKDHLPEGVTITPQDISPTQFLLLGLMFLITATIVIVAFFFVWGGYRQNGTRSIALTAIKLSATLVVTPQTTSIPLLINPTPTTEPSPTLTLSPTISPTPNASPTSTPAPPTPAAALETPFGPGGEYILHKVITGDSLGKIAFQYKTSAAVLMATNVFPISGLLQVDMVLVVIPNLSENPGLPAFQPIYLDQDASVIALAQEYGVHADDLRFYNALGPSDQIPAGRWIIIPLPPSSRP